jgi:APA family basic amino acid/polyamine antiporter
MKSTAVANLVGVKEVGLVAAEAILGTKIGQLMGGIISLLLVSTISSMVFTGPRVLAKMFENISSMSFISKRESDGNPRIAIGGIADFVVCDGFSPTHLLYCFYAEFVYDAHRFGHDDSALP